MHHFQSKQKILVDQFWQKFDIFSMLYKIDSTIFILRDICLQCFDAVGWAAGRASGL